MSQIQIKRIYETYSIEDGTRILVDRLWPRGVKKETARIDDWQKNIAPSNELRKWFGHDPKKFEDFQIHYRQELNENEYCPDFLKEIKVALGHGNVTLIYAAKDHIHNHAIVLQGWIQEQLRS